MMQGPSTRIESDLGSLSSLLGKENAVRIVEHSETRGTRRIQDCRSRGAALDLCDEMAQTG